MNGWYDQPIIIAVLSAVVGVIGTIFGAYWRLRLQGINSSTAEEIMERARFRADLIQRVKDLSARLDQAEADHADCESREMALRKRVYELEISISRMQGGDFQGKLV